ncbi:putative membrane protein [Synechococcus sp. BIOS-E4-1]|nr:putative membrane protein [Synechococcus sp. BIOS-E4-1]
MDEDSSKTTKTVWFWVIGLNVITWGGYLFLTRVMGITFDSVH